MASSSVLAAAVCGILEDLLGRDRIPTMVCLLCAVFRRVTAVHLNKVVEISRPTDAIHLLIFVRGRARSTDKICHEQWIDTRTMTASRIEWLSRIASLAPMVTSDLIGSKITVPLVPSIRAVLLVGRRVISFSVMIV